MPDAEEVNTEQVELDMLGQASSPGMQQGKQLAKILCHDSSKPCYLAPEALAFTKSSELSSTHSVPAPASLRGGNPEKW